jgi:dihydrofolate synthase/folylpolyglutamate synthase
MSLGTTIEYLYGLQKYGMKFGLDNITKLLAAAGNPHRSFRSVHVAGTNGKGSTSAITESILRTSGVTTGLFTSPHLVNFSERIRVGGTEIPEKDIIDLAEEVRGLASGLEDFSPTFFEVVATMAFLYFKRMKVDWAVVEVGLGGRLDATNVIMPEVSVITSIGFDHREFLGRTLKEIAGEKAGIIKEERPVVSAPQQPEAMEVIERRCEEKKSPLFSYGRDFSAVTKEIDESGVALDYSGVDRYGGLRIPLRGGHQVINASLAIKTIEIISGLYPEISCDVRKGLETVNWPGRLDMVRSSPAVMIDGAHNPEAACVLSAYLRKLLKEKYRRIILVLGIMGDKDIDGILGHLLPLSAATIFTAPAYGRAASPEALARRASDLNYEARTAPTVAEALAMAEDLRHPGDLVVVTGSFYTIGEVREILGTKGVLSRLRE